MIPDLINGIYEFGGALYTIVNIRAVLKDKQIKGVRPSPIIWFTTWGFYNMYYYPHLDQWASFTGGCCIVVTNMIYVSLMIYFMRKNNGKN